MEIEKLDDIDIKAASELVLASYEEERKAFPHLPNAQDYQDLLMNKLKHLVSEGKGIIALEDDELIGFMGGYMIDELYGECKGVYSPVYGHGTVRKDKKGIYQEMYRCAADRWVEEHLTSHAVSLFSYDEDIIDTFFWMGFGLRCVDAVRKVNSISSETKTFDIKKAKKDDITRIANIHRKHNLYYRSSPIFMPNEEDPKQDLTEWFKKEDHHLWIACQDSEPLGYMRIQPKGESFISEHASIMNITGAYIEPNYRRSGIGVRLLDTIQKWLQKNNYLLCGVDFESINTSACNFWKEYFTPYIYSLVRRIDERIL